MLTKDDKDWLVESFVTRGEHLSDISGIKGDLQELKTNMNKVLNAVDKFSGRVAILEQENKMGAITTRRHGMHIQELAKATGTVLST